MYFIYFLVFLAQWCTFGEFSGFHYHKQFRSGHAWGHIHPCFLSGLQADAWPVAGLTGAHCACPAGGLVSGWGARSSSSSKLSLVFVSSLLCEFSYPFNFLTGGIEAQTTCCLTCCLAGPQITTQRWMSPETGGCVWGRPRGGFLRVK